MSVKAEVVIKNHSGLHARPAALFIQTANKFKADIVVSSGVKQVNAKSIISVLSLGARGGTQVTIEAEGPDAEQAVKDLVFLLSTIDEGE
ncbi:MAG: HPr family phosphocarrier protein [Desulfitobacteriaceae bacterium]